MHSLPYPNVKVQASHVADGPNMHEWFLGKSMEFLGESVLSVAKLGYIVPIAYEMAVISMNVVYGIISQIVCVQPNDVFRLGYNIYIMSPVYTCR